MSFEGYRPEAYGTKTAYEKAVTVSKEYKQPQWVLTTSKITKYAAISDLIKIGVYDKADKTKTLIPLTAEALSLDTAKLKNAYTLEQIKDNQMYIRVTGNKASEKLPILIAKDNFRDAKKLTLKLALKGENVLPAYKVSPKKITLNKNYAETEKVVVNLKVGTESNQEITGLNVYFNNNLYQNDEVAFNYLAESGQIQVCLQKNAVGTGYDFQITPKISNLQGEVTSVVITNDYSTLFDAKVVNGRIVITAKDASEETKLINKNKYKLNLKITTQSGHIFENVAFTVTPKQGVAKIEKSVNKITCFKPVKGVKYRAPLKFTVTSPAQAQIEEIRLLNNTDHFVYDAENEVLYLKNADMLTAKNHKLTFEVTCKGACDNVKATKVTMTVSLKK